MAWTESSVNGYTVLEETGLTIADNEGGDTEYVTVSSVIDTGLYPGWEDNKFPVMVKVTTAGGGAGVMDAFLQTSHQSAATGDTFGGSSVTPLWADATSAQDLTATCLVNATTSNTGQIDASSVKAPYARIALKVASTTDIVNSNGRCTITVCIPGDKATKIATIGGIGADPS